MAIDADRPLRHAIEVRHPSFATEDFIALARCHGIALVTADTARKYPLLEDLTSDFVYLRLHGDTELYRSGYTTAALRHWAARIVAWQRGDEPPDAVRISSGSAPHLRARDVYCFFDNTDVKLRAPQDAQSLMRLLGIEPGRPQR